MPAISVSSRITWCSKVTFLSADRKLDAAEDIMLEPELETEILNDHTWLTQPIRNRSVSVWWKRGQNISGLGKLLGNVSWKMTVLVGIWATVMPESFVQMTRSLIVCIIVIAPLPPSTIVSCLCPSQLRDENTTLPLVPPEINSLLVL
ncbi:hypothetical protein OGATHE_006253 [Ogataea polymorpha]|uniref:Uncharacterized protein n=1 Tax=Ogataea polymorpha TaxID=460523 RepID=A0A9P8NUM3_9ASCO|nr:hypothetical protein OGATHE_006253 [Ogataea polymorpha]